MFWAQALRPYGISLRLILDVTAKIPKLTRPKKVLGSGVPAGSIGSKLSVKVKLRISWSLKALPCRSAMLAPEAFQIFTHWVNYTNLVSVVKAVGTRI